MNILHITSITSSKTSGVYHAVSKYLYYEKKYSNVAVLNVQEQLEISGVSSYNYQEYNTISKLPLPFNKPDIVIFNEVYKKEYIKLYKECIKNNIKYIIIPHGCLLKEAQNRKKIKKMVANIIIFNNFIKKARAIQFLNNREKENSIFNHKESIIFGNGVEKNEFINKAVNNDMIYIGRFDVLTKGLDILANICHKNKKWFIDNEIRIQLYGNAGKKNQEKLNKIITNLGIENIMIQNEPIYGADKEQVLLNSYCFVQLSRHEGQPMGLLEALSYGIPCIVTYGTSLGEYINKKRCGFGVKNNEEEIFSKIKEIYMNKDERNILSRNAKKEVIKDYNWDNIISQTIKAYNDLIDE